MAVLNAGTTADLHISAPPDKNLFPMLERSVQFIRKNLIVSFFSADESARLSMHDNKDVEGHMADNFAGKGVK